MAFTDVFGSQTLPPAEYGYKALALTGDLTLIWPYNSDDTSSTIAKIMDVSSSAAYALTLPDATEVSTGEDFLIRNTGAFTITVNDSTGVQVATVSAGAASYFYLTSNATTAGVFGVIGFGVGTSTVDASSLVGYGIKAVGSSLNQSHPVIPTASPLTLDDTHRAKLVVFTGGSGTFSLTSAPILGDDYFTLFRNDGTGTVTIDPASSETIDGLSTMSVQPGESLILVCTGTQWYSVGYGRSILYQFTQLTKDVSAGGTITLTAAEASNKLITFIGSPAGAVNVVVPSVVAVYYLQSSISTPQTVTVKTSAGSGVGLSQGARIIALCDATNVVSAQSVVANSSISLTDGSVSTPSLFFATKTNTGLYKSSTQDLGITINGSSVGVFGATGLQISSVGPNSSQQHTLPAVASSTVALTGYAQTFTVAQTVSITDNTNPALKVTQLGTGHALLIEDEASPDSTPLLVDSLGRLRIGSTLVQAVNSAGYIPHLNILGGAYSTPYAGAALNLAQYAVSDLSAASLWFSKSATDTVGSDAAVTTADRLASLNFSGNYGSGYIPAAQVIAAMDTGTVSSTSMPGKISILTTPNGATAPVEAFTVRASGDTEVLNNLTVGNNAGVNVNLKAGITGTSGAINWTFNTTSTVYGSISLPYDTRSTVGLKLETANAYPITLNSGNGYIFQGDNVTHTVVSDGGNWIMGAAAQPTGFSGGGLNLVGKDTFFHLSMSRVTDDINSPAFYFNKSRGTYASPTSPILNDSIGSIFFQVYNAAAGATQQAASILGVVDGEVGTAGDITDAPGALSFRTSADGSSTPAERLNINSAGLVICPNSTGLGYGASSGGTVTQATSKSTGVTLSKATGQITMNAAALAAATRVAFTLTNTLIEANDTIICHRKSGGTASAYTVTVDSVATGSCVIALRNDTAGSLSEAVVLQFSVIKGSIA